MPPYKLTWLIEQIDWQQTHSILFFHRYHWIDQQRILTKPIRYMHLMQISTHLLQSWHCATTGIHPTRYRWQYCCKYLQKLIVCWRFVILKYVLIATGARQCACNDQCDLTTLGFSQDLCFLQKNLGILTFYRKSWLLNGTSNACILSNILCTFFTYANLFCGHWLLTVWNGFSFSQQFKIFVAHASMFPKRRISLTEIKDLT